MAVTPGNQVMMCQQFLLHLPVYAIAVVENHV
jgi:hypothetical protein